jgi:superoxide dismutase
MFKKITIIMMGVSIIALLAACSSPEKKGRKLGQLFCDCQKEYVETQNKIYQEYLDKFDSYGFKTRTEARQKWQDLQEDAKRQYEQCQQKIEEKVKKARAKFPTNVDDLYDAKSLQKAMKNPKAYTKELEKRQKEFSKNQEKSRKFEQALKDVINQCSTSEVKDYSAIDAKIMTIIPSLNPAKLKQDLVKRRIIEQADGYFGRGWAWQITSIEEIKEVKIENEEKQGDDYVLNVHLILQKEGASQYNADVKIICVLGKNDDWTIDFIETKNIGIVKTGRYDNCVITEIRKSWGTYLQFTNSCDVNLIIGGQILENDNEWRKFSSRVNANTTGSISYNGKEYKIDFIERQ